MKKEFWKNTLYRRDVTNTPTQFHAYDLETSNIPRHDTEGGFDESTPTPLYITGYSEKPTGDYRPDGSPVLDIWELSKPLRGLKDLKRVLLSHFLIDDRIGERYIAWNGNNFDIYFVALSLLETDYILRPYLTKNNAVRGLRVVDRADNKRFWEFLDGIAMTGITAPLKKFLATFAPSFQKLDLNFDATEFDKKNPDHVAYALRDSVGLFHALKACDVILSDLTDGLHLTPTIGNLGIKYFQKTMPDDIRVHKPDDSIIEQIHLSLKRGGYCWLSRRFSGPVWKYDINQAYAAAMRECSLPAGTMLRGIGRCASHETAIYLISATAPDDKRPPFYWKDLNGKASYSLEVDHAWITRDEYLQLEREGWALIVEDMRYWSDTFSMDDMVNRLEHIRTTDPGGPGGPVGQMCKSLGNNAYGKTAERLSGLEIVMASECPDDYSQHRQDTPYIWARPTEDADNERGYHQPQLASFITAYVRMVVRRAILKNFPAWIYADTDCVVFTEPVALDIDPKLYGKWKQETDGEEYRFIVKKGYFSADKVTVHAKGMNIKKRDGSNAISDAELESWWRGSPPEQSQTQRKNFLKVISGAPMYHGRKKVAEKVATKKET